MFKPVFLTSGTAFRQFTILVLLSANSSVFAVEWIQAHEGKLYNISGMAVLAQNEDRTEFVVVHDNKKKDEPRLGVVVATPNKVEYRALAWPNGEDSPSDLESISSVPDQPGQFLALCSDGRLFSLTVAGENVTVLAEFMLPELPPEVNIEGFSVRKLGDQLLAAWGHRGAGEEQGILFWGLLDLQMKRVINVSKTEIGVPFPLSSDPNTRHIADLKIDANGVVWAAATNDPGDDGPFVSAVYTLGALRAGKSPDIQFERNRELTKLWTFAKKVESIEFVPGPQGAIAFGTDDENEGGWLFFQQAEKHRETTVSAEERQ